MVSLSHCFLAIDGEPMRLETQKNSNMKVLAIISLFVFLSYPMEQVSVEKEMKKETLSMDASTPKTIVFLAGFDQGDNTYYNAAKNYFQSHDYQVVDSLYSLQEILVWLNYDRQVRYKEVHIVSHSNPWRGMSMKVAPGGGRITEQSLEKAIAESVLPTLTNALSEDAKLIFHACGLGTNRGLLNQLKKVFTQECAPTIYASPLYSVFGDRFSTSLHG